MSNEAADANRRKTPRRTVDAVAWAAAASWALTAILLVWAGHVRADVFLLIVPVGLLLVPVFFIVMIVRGIQLLVRRTRADAVCVARNLTNLLVCAGLALGLWHGQQSICRRIESEAGPLIAAIEKYRGDHGSYPEDGKALVPAYLDKLPSCPGRRSMIMIYALYDGKIYTLTCVTFGFWKYSYSSENGEWRGWD
jgi:hypothetical protein